MYIPYPGTRGIIPVYIKIVAGIRSNLEVLVERIPTHKAPKKLPITTSVNNLTITYTNHPAAPINEQLNSDFLGALKNIANANVTINPAINCI